jgi:DNA-binding MarR family transcriptional regulator
VRPGRAAYTRCERQPDPADRRISLISLTPEGARLASQLADVLAGHLRDLCLCPGPVSRT